MYSEQLSVQEGAILDSQSPKRDSQSLSVSCFESLVRVVRGSMSDTVIREDPPTCVIRLDDGHTLTKGQYNL